LEEYRKHGGHPVYGEEDIIYRFNSFGYRCVDFTEAAQIRMVSIGCSWVFGVGLAQRDLFHELFAQRLRRELATTVVNWNLGRSGASNDYIARVLHLAVPRLRPHVVLVLFTASNRREYITADNRLMNFNSLPPQNSHWVERETWTHFNALTNGYDDQLNLFRNYKSVETLLADYVWLFSATNTNDLDLEPLAGHLDESHRAKKHRFVDKARDHGHPGPETHKLLADLFWAKFLETGELAQLRRSLSSAGTS
jgi:hypothetical protein